ncbi:MAG TPA: ThuA domain-containing protein [Bryobacteraceae bacterium]|nr:ThuA domain-containing protein [Bryobacteraceae bacterium]
MRLLLALLLLQGAAFAQPKQVLYLTHSAGFQHDVLPLSQQVLRDIGERSGKFTVTTTDNLSALNDLGRYAAVMFFTSGELALSDTQKQRLLDFVRNGGGFAGFHSATDTLYTWPEYGELIGGRFDGHPWTQEVRIDVEDTDHPATRHLESSFAITDEIYQFRDFSRARVRVLMTLDINGDYPLAWTRLYGSGRVFYSALGHFDSTWQDPRFKKMLEEAVLWITWQTEGEGQPRTAAQPILAENGVGNAATMEPRMTIAPGSLVSIYGAGLTTGSSMAATGAARLAGPRVLLNGRAAQLLYASPGQVNFVAPADLASQGTATLTVQPAGSPVRETTVALRPSTAGIFVTTVSGTHATLWATGLGTTVPRVTVNGIDARITYSGPAPGWIGLDQVNIEIPPSATAPYVFALH